MKKLLLLLPFIVMLSVAEVSAQKQGQELIDSLQTALNNYDAKRTELNKISYDISDSLKVNTLLFLIQNLTKTGDFTKAKNYADDALAIAKKINFKKGIGRVYYNIGNIYADQDNYPEALKNDFAALKIKEEIGDKKGVASCYNNIGIIYKDQCNYPDALKNHFAALKIRKEIGEKKGIASSYSNIGIIYMSQGNYLDALNNYFAALKIFEEIGEKKGIAVSNINIGNIYISQENYSDALKNYFAALKIYEEIEDKRGIANSYNNIGNIYNQERNCPNALENYFAALKINEEVGDKKGIANALNNIGNIYAYQHNYPDALKNDFAAFKIFEEMGDKIGIAASYCNLGNVNTKLKKYTEAKKYLKDGLSLSKEIGSNYAIKDIYNGLIDLDSATGNWKDAYLHYKLYILYQDSLVNEENTKKTVQAQMNYEFDKKEAATKAEQDKKDAVAKQEKQKQKLITYSISAGLFLVMLLALFIFRSYRQKQKANLIITKQKEEVEEKNRQITDSITYALRIQTAILPPTKLVKQYLNDSFILYKPKDIVAGDFYWMETVQCADVPMNQFGDEENSNTSTHLHTTPSVHRHIDKSTNQIILFAACDCTGHGVSGAMVSVMCHNALNRAVKEFGLIQPAAILDKVDELVIENFSKGEDDVKDGMDISLCALHLPSPLERGKGVRLEWAGANSPLWIVRNNSSNKKDSLAKGEVLETKADKQPIGKFEGVHAFTNHELTLQGGDSIYIFSDGYADQFGGETGKKKLTRKRFRELLLSMQQIPFAEQGKELDKFMSTYLGSNEQIDDILVMGVRV